MRFKLILHYGNVIIFKYLCLKFIYLIIYFFSSVLLKISQFNYEELPALKSVGYSSKKMVEYLLKIHFNTNLI